MPGTEPLLKQLRLTTDAALMALFTDLTSNIAKTHKNDADSVAISLITAWKKRLQLQNLSEKALQDMLNVCEKGYMPIMSNRLTQSGKQPEGVSLGDSLLLPQGLFQKLSVKSDSGKEHFELVKILSYAVLKQNKLIDLVPTIKARFKAFVLTKKTLKQDIHYGDTHYQQVNKLNHLIAMEKKGLWIGSEFGIAGSSIISNYSALASILEEELQRRKLQQPTKKTVMPSPKLASLVKLYKTPQPEDERPLEDMRITMQTITDQLNSQTASTLSPPYKQRSFENSETIEIYQTHATEDVVAMAATSDTVTLYGPFLRERKLSYHDKASLCLKALGIPPLNGRDTIEIEGASDEFRQAITRCFEALKEEDNSLRIKPEH